MLKRNNKLIALLLITAVSGMTVMGCNKKEDTAVKVTDSKVNDVQGSVYPVKTDVTLKIWSTYAPSNVKVATDVPMYKELEKRTGIKVEFINDPGSGANNNYDVMVASGSLPDLIERDWYGISGGPEKPISDGVIIKLNDAIDKYAPNLKKYLQANPEVNKSVKTDSGAYYVFPFLRGDKYCQVYQGPMVRQDWMDDLGLKAPVTVDDWYAMLKQFKDKKGAKAPLSYQGWQLNQSRAFVGAYGIAPGIYVENGKIKYGELEPGYKEYLKTWRNWYSEGLIFDVDGKTLDENILNDAAGAVVSNAGGGMGKWNPLLTKANPKAKLAGVNYPTLKAGEKVKFSQYDAAYTTFGCWAITSQCKNIEVAARWLDFGYSEAGRMLYNFGVEGESYNMVNGYPKYTELITKNPQGLTMPEMLGKYVRANNSGPFIQDKRYVEQFLSLPEQQNAVKLWADTEVEKTALPKVILSPEESKEVSEINKELDAYKGDMFNKFVKGEESIENYDKYVQQLKKLRVDRVIQLYQQALDRYNKR